MENNLEQKITDLENQLKEIREQNNSGFSCKDCGRIFMCPICHRPYKNAEEAIKSIKKGIRIGEVKYCDSCAENYINCLKEKAPNLWA